MPMDAALAWSRQDWEREQAEQQRRLLDLAQAPRRSRRTTRQRRAGRQAGGLQRRRPVPAYAATLRRRWTGVKPLDPRPEQPAGAATAGRWRRLQRRRRRRLHVFLPPFRYVEHVFLV
jgi:hypothetical protein